MKKTKRLWALLLAVVMALGLITTAFAAPTIDSGRKASLSLYKYDITAASADGAWDAASYVSTGVQDDAVTDKLAKYAIQGVEFTYLRVASISTYSQRENGQYKVGVLYGFAFFREDLMLGTYEGPMIRKDLLDAVGETAPVTIDDWNRVLYKFQSENVVKYPLSPVRVF